MSSIDPSKPTAGQAYTADVRANFAAAKAEIESIESSIATLNAEAARGVISAVAGSALSPGDAVTLSAGAPPIATRANAASSSSPAHGIVMEAAASGAPVRVAISGRAPCAQSVPPGTRLFLSASTPGGLTATPTMPAGGIWQPVGIALSAGLMAVQPQPPIAL